MKVEMFGPSDRKTLKINLQNWLDAYPDVTIHFIAQSQDGAGWFTFTIFYE